MACLGSEFIATTSTGISQPADSAGGNVRASADKAEADITAAARFSAAKPSARASSWIACFGDALYPKAPACDKSMVLDWCPRHLRACDQSQGCSVLLVTIVCI